MSEYSANVLGKVPSPSLHTFATLENAMHSLYSMDTPLFPVTPDIPERCPDCGHFIRISDKLDHSVFHKALATFGYSGSELPENIYETLERRKALIQANHRKLNSARRNINPKDPKRTRSKRSAYESVFFNKVTEINLAFSLLKLYLEDDFDPEQKPHSSVFISGRSNVSFPKSKDHILMAVSLNDTNMRWQKFQNSRSVFIDGVSGRDHLQLAGIYSGRNGAGASQLCYEKLHEMLENELDKIEDERVSESDLVDSRNGLQKIRGNTRVQKYHEAFESALQKIDELCGMGADEVSCVQWSSASVLSLLVDSVDMRYPMIHVSSCGDGRILACRDGKPIRLNKFHNLSNSSEKRRVSEDPECLKQIKKHKLPTRGIGNYGDPILRKCIVSKPSTVSYILPGDCEFLVLASGSVFSALTEEQVMTACKSVLPKYFMDFRREIQEKVEKDEEENNKGKLVHFGNPEEEVPAPVEDTREEDDAEKENSDSESSLIESEPPEEAREPTPPPPAPKLPSQSATLIGIPEPELSLQMSRVELGSCKWQESLPALGRSMAEKVALSAMKNGAKENVSVIVLFTPAILSRLSAE